MQKITIGTAQKLTSPNPFALLSVRRPDGKTNLAAVSWWTYASNHPASLAVCLSKKGYSGECIMREKAFSLSVVGAELRGSAFSCGCCSGRDTDKAEAFSIALMSDPAFAADPVAGSRVCFSCRLAGSCEVGDHQLYIAEVTAILGDESVDALYAMNGYAGLGTAAEKR